MAPLITYKISTLLTFYPYYIELNLEDDRTDNDDPHVNATIISHAGYLINQYGMTKEEIADLFFNAMPALAGEPEFDEVAHILIDTAKRISSGMLCT